MTNVRHKPITCTSRGQKDWAPRSLAVEAEREDRNRQAEHEYLPMDVFLDLNTIKEHFQYYHRSAAG
jgi:hypothetical protein